MTMTRSGWTVSAFLICSAAVPATAGVVVIGNNPAKVCFDAAEAEGSPGRSALVECDRALFEEGLTTRDTVATHVNRGIIRARLGNLDGALSDFDRASALNPDEPEAYLNKALLLAMRTEQPAEALPLFTMALQKKTKRPELAYFGRAAANEDLGNVRSAYADYVSAAAVAPKWNAPRVELARFNLRRR
jgi:tetratricopeptide (TPR) repeat protein